MVSKISGSQMGNMFSLFTWYFGPVLTDRQASRHQEESKKLKAFALKLKKELEDMKEKVSSKLLAWIY